jgi:hypothetical protein
MTNALVAQQKNINDLRKAVTRAKTALKDIQGNIKYYGECAEDPVVGREENKAHLHGLVAKYTEMLPKAEAQLATAISALAAAEAALPPVKESPFSAILKWFSGAALVKAREALQLLDASVEHGSWIPGASRKVRAALGKANVAAKTLEVTSDYSGPKAEVAVYRAFTYGAYGSMLMLSAVEIRRLSAEAQQFVADFKPVALTMERLDATRPVPVFTTMNASRTVSAELKRQGAVNVEVCPIKWEFQELVDDNGVTSYVPVAILLWPEGIKHHTSRYAWGTSQNRQCEACGHAIKNNYNWVPLILTTEAGEKKSLWVGRDCAETLFGVKMTGDLEIAKGQI